jgi:hypothetical protein
MSEHRCFRFAYTLPYREDRKRFPFQMRDTDAATFLLRGVEERGYQLKEVIINYPSPGPDLVPFDDGFLTESDLILLTTRPPMHDTHIGDRKSIARSYTTLEDKLFKGPLARHFAFLARSEVRLTDGTARIAPEIAKRQSSIYRQNGGATYHSYGSPITREWRHFKKAAPLTAAFLVYAEHAWPGGPALLAAFGMGGTETLVWCHQLGNRLQHLLFSTSFAMAELRNPLLAARPTTSAFANAWEADILGFAEPKPRSGPRRAA